MALGRLVRTPLNAVIAGVIAASFLIGTLALMIENRAAILRDGKEIVLRVEPVDPRDLMRGDYVRLAYGGGVSLVDDKLVVGDWPAENTVSPVWLVLAAGDDGLFTTRSIHFSRPGQLEIGEVVLKSKPARIWVAKPPDNLNEIARLSFGIERYYVPEGEGLEIEKARNEGRTTVAIRVSDRGEPQIARLMIDGETLYKEPLY
ncbi:GDYXXLXY domain-containing protein [Hoeflea sp.]|uniref:GDYXXLXY domain-containing protein n=1 Tax=Hoeflea sp. TaxID=1940281 RepID=UPI00374A6A74